MSLLTLDIGNTRTKAGLFRQGVLVDQQVWAVPTPDEVLAYGQMQEVEAAMYCSVADPNGDLAARMQELWPTWQLTHETPLPFVNAYHTPQTLGKDRLAAAAGVQALWPGEAAVVVDCGTCIKYEWVTADGTYRGGNIAPGLQMRIRAMHEFTARLPEVPMKMPDSPVGYSTETALQNGALRGAVLEIEGFVQLLERVAGAAVRVVLTGGDAGFLCPYLHLERLTVQPDLVLYGLHDLLRYQLTSSMSGAKAARPS